ncbi:acyl-CoA N-acyltransferase [Aspergillus bertholletiae]|uniref:Acyl-CoA N-acyltransferase n=1 Tax=Aspergillus bertholletiae TaxID=1226010 RepID=A0A5N7AWQ7_9EURO|nr:acyl-CoA N-acyltransferase [Aspergillus bertholletiae]
MFIRQATSADIHDIARVAVAAYIDDPQDAYQYPKRASFPAVYLNAKSSIIKSSLEDLTAIPVVAVLEPGDKEAWRSNDTTIIGYCIWYREHEDADDEEKSKEPDREPLVERIKNRIMNSSIVEFFSDLVNPILDSSHARAMARVCSDPDSRRFEEGYQKPRNYYGVLDVGVDPTFQRQGAARRLMEWGMERAEKENLPVYLSATPAGQPLYKSLGFRTVGKWIWRPNQDSEWDIMQWDHFPGADAVKDERQKVPLQ